MKLRKKEKPEKGERKWNMNTSNSHNGKDDKEICKEMKKKIVKRKWIY